MALAALARAQDPVSMTMSVSPSTIPAGGRGSANVTVNLADGWKMYSITQGAGGPVATRITLDKGPFKLGSVSGPKPHTGMDPNFGIVTETYSGNTILNAQFRAEPGTPDGPQTLKLNVRYQVCNDTVCLPPKTITFEAAMMIGRGKGGASAAAMLTPTPAVADTNSNVAADRVPPLAVSPPAGSDIGSQPLWGLIWLAMTFGALSLLTPCVFPMIPITVSYFTKHGSDSRLGSVRDAGIYALGIILTFTGLGIALAVVFGAAGINRFASNPYVNLLITAIFLAFAFSLLGAYNMGVPSSLLTKLDKATRSKESGKVAALLLMGLTFSLTSFTCTAPLVGAVLVTAAQGDLIYPIVAMLAFSSVFALPFFVLALAPNLVQSLPRSGSWMNSVKVIMGFLEVGAALKFLSNVDLIWHWGIFTREVVIAGWIALSILSFLYLLGVFKFSHDSEDQRVGLVRVLIAFVFGTVTFFLLTGLFGSRLGEIESFLPPMKESAISSSGGTTPNGELTWITNDYQAALVQAKEQKKRIFIDYTGYTCTNCRWMEANMFPKAGVKAELSKYVRVRLYTDGEGEPYQGFQRMQEERFGTVALPLYAIVTPDDEIVRKFEGLTRSEATFVAFLQE